MSGKIVAVQIFIKLIMSIFRNNDNTLVDEHFLCYITGKKKEQDI